MLVFSAATVSDAYRAASRYETASERADTKLKRSLEWLSLGLYKGASEKVEKVESLNEIAAFHQRRVEWSGWLLLGLSLAFLTFKSTQARRSAKASLQSAGAASDRGVGDISAGGRGRSHADRRRPDGSHAAG